MDSPVGGRAKREGEPRRIAGNRKKFNPASCRDNREAVTFEVFDSDREENVMARTAAKQPAGKRVEAPKRTRLLIATRKGLWTLTTDGARRTWKLAGPQFLGHIVHHAMLDPRDGKTLLAAARTGHLGPTVFRSTDNGKTWKERSRRRRSTPAADASSTMRSG
jgi:hypothetical protein